MAAHLTNQDNNLAKQIKLQMFIICILTLALAVSLFLYFTKTQPKFVPPQTKEVKFKTSVDDNTAGNGISNYTRITSPTSIYNCQGVYYDSADIADFLKIHWPAIKRRHESYMQSRQISLPKNCDWKVGFYWMARSSAPNKDSLGFYVTPLIVDTMKKQVFDYFNIRFKDYYHHNTPNKPNENNIFDEGQLWP